MRAAYNQKNFLFQGFWSMIKGKGCTGYEHIAARVKRQIGRRMPAAVLAAAREISFGGHGRDTGNGPETTGRTG